MGYDLIIIGAGPAGLTAAIYASRAKLTTLVLAGEKWGGQLMLTTTVENFPGFPQGIQGPELMKALREQAEKFGAQILEKEVVKVDFKKRPFKVFVGGGKPLATRNQSDARPGLDGSLERSFSLAREETARNFKGKSKSPLAVSSSTLVRDGFAAFKTKAVIIAAGAAARWLGVPGEKRLIGRGVSTCAPCDAFFFKDKRVIVVGGGDSAMEEALVLANFSSEVTIVHRRGKFRASKALQERVLRNKKIKILLNSQVLEILGNEKVEGVKLETKNKKQKTKNRLWEMAVEGVFVAIGHKPRTEIFAGQVNLDKKGYVVKTQNSKLKTQKYQMMTSVPGVFVAGDVHDYHYKQAVTAAGFGCMAALDAEHWLEEKR